MAPTILCLASYFKGGAFLEECKRLGCHTILITSQDLEHEAWPRAAIDEFFVMPFANLFKQPDITNAVSYLARNRKIDRIIALDDFDVETVADLREHLRMPGMGGSTARYFRDKLAMRVQARDEGIPVPEFVHVLNYDDVRDYMHRVPGPWVLKPRSEASSMGIRKVNSPAELWPILDELGDRQSYYVLEKFVPGDVFHVDSIVWNKQVLFTVCSKYGLPPMAVYQGGGVFVTGNLPYHAPEEQALQALNREVIAAMGMVRGVTHAEFIRAEADGDLPLPGDCGPRRRRQHRPDAGARHGHQSLARVGAAGTGSSEQGRVHVAADPPGLCGARRLAGAPALARHLRLQRPGAGLAAAKGASRRLHRRRARSWPRATTHRRLCRPHCAGLYGVGATQGRRKAGLAMPPNDSLSRQLFQGRALCRRVQSARAATPSW